MNPANGDEILIPGALAALGGGVGVFALLCCARPCEMSGYAKGDERVPQDEAVDL